jgi:hypothetical protein
LRPPVLVLDEPTSGLDPAGTRLVGEALAGFAAGTGTAIVVVEHKTALLADLADECALLAGGRIVAHGPTRDVLADERLVELGVEPPPAVRLQRAAAARGLAIDPAILEASRDRGCPNRRRRFVDPGRPRALATWPRRAQGERVAPWPERLGKVDARAPAQRPAPPDGGRVSLFGRQTACVAEPPDRRLAPEPDR